MYQPTVSILLSVYNGQKTIQRCLDSIATQTYDKIEIIAIDDASSDESLLILKQWKANHPHIPMTLIHNEQNQGLTKSLMIATQQATGLYLARIDVDDWWLPSKLATQVSFLEEHPEYGLVGCWYINKRSTKQQHVVLPVSDSDIRGTIFWRNPFGHSCVLMRKNIFNQVKGYDITLRYGQDRDLWFRFLPITKLANIPEVLCYRTVGPTISTTNTRAQIWQQFKTVHTYIQLYKMSPMAYLSFIEPLAVFLTPPVIRRYIRLVYDHLFTH